MCFCGQALQVEGCFMASPLACAAAAARRDALAASFIAIAARWRVSCASSRSKRRGALLAYLSAGGAAAAGRAAAPWRN